MHDRPQAARRRERRAATATPAPDRPTSEVPPGLALQRSAGNQAVSDLIEGAQAKLAVGRVDDPLEHQADAVAAEVVDAVRTGSVTAGVARRGVARRRPQTAGGATAAPDGPGGGPVDPGVEAQVESGRGGRPLSASTREPLERAFGNADFSGVRVHAGPDATDLNESFGAEAFTVGSDIFFRDGVPAPTDPLLAHELTHVVQQDEAGPRDRSISRSTAGTSLRRKESLDEKFKQHRSARNPGRSKSGAQKAATTGLEIGQFVQGTTKDVVGGIAGPAGMVQNRDGNPADPNSQEHKDANPYSAEVQDGLTVAGGVTDIAGGITSVAAAIRTFRKGGSSSWDKVGALYSGGEALAGAATGAAKIAKTAAQTDEVAEGAGDSAGLLGMVTSELGTIKHTFFAVKEIVELVKKGSSNTDSENVRKSVGVVKSSLEAVKSGVSTVKKIMDLMESGGGAALTTTVPIIGIAVGASELVIRGVDIVYSFIRWGEVRGRKRALKSRRRGEDKAKGDKRSKESLKHEARAIMDDANSGDDDVKWARTYLTARDLQYIEAKRLRRQSMQVSLTMTKMSGDVAVLSGAGAGVGVGLKLGATGVGAGATGFRALKQLGRDRKASKEGKGKDVPFYLKPFNAKKSSKKKEEKYNQNVDAIFEAIIATHALQDAGDFGDFVEAAEDLRLFLASAETTWAQVEAMQDDIPKLRAHLITNLKRRE